MSHFRTAVVVSFLFATCLAAAGPGAAAGPAAPAQVDRDLQEVQGYRLSMDVVRKMSAVYKAAAAEEAEVRYDVWVITSNPCQIVVIKKT